MKKLCFLLCFLPFIVLGLDSKEKEIAVIMFKQGVVHASTCHVKYTISEVIFRLKEKGLTEEWLTKAKELDDKLASDIVNFNGDKMDYLNAEYNKCIEEGVKDNERKYK